MLGPEPAARRPSREVTVDDTLRRVSLFAGLDEEERKQLHGLLAQVADSSGVLEGCVELVKLSD